MSQMCSCGAQGEYFSTGPTETWTGKYYNGNESVRQLIHYIIITVAISILTGDLYMDPSTPKVCRLTVLDISFNYGYTLAVISYYTASGVNILYNVICI